MRREVIEVTVTSLVWRSETHNDKPYDIHSSGHDLNSGPSEYEARIFDVRCFHLEGR